MHLVDLAQKSSSNQPPQGFSRPLGFDAAVPQLMSHTDSCTATTQTLLQASAGFGRHFQGFPGAFMVLPVKSLQRLAKPTHKRSTHSL